MENAKILINKGFVATTKRKKLEIKKRVILVDKSKSEYFLE
jgi:hypothetical protein